MFSANNYQVLHIVEIRKKFSIQLDKINTISRAGLNNRRCCRLTHSHFRFHFLRLRGLLFMCEQPLHHSLQIRACGSLHRQLPIVFDFQPKKSVTVFRLGTRNLLLTLCFSENPSRRESRQRSTLLCGCVECCQSQINRKQGDSHNRRNETNLQVCVDSLVTSDVIGLWLPTVENGKALGMVASGASWCLEIISTEKLLRHKVTD